jgi:hypothetical protein
MPTLSYLIFNKHLPLSEEVIENFIKEIEKLFKKFKEDKDIDNLKVLKNKLTNLLEEHKDNIIKTSKKEYHILIKMIEKFDEYIIKQVEKSEKSKLIDVVVEEVEKNYKTCDMIPNKKRDQYKQFCVKTKKIEYEKELITLQVELLKLQNHIKNSKQKVLIIFEGRDAA